MAVWCKGSFAVRCLLLSFALFCPFLNAWPQATDSLTTAIKGTEERTDQELRVHRNTVWASCLPGAGQIANRKYWKAPLVWAGMAYMVDYCAFNVRQFRAAKENLRFETDSDPTTVNTTGLTAIALEESAVFYRRNRDLAILGIMGVHLLSILDANVDAHLMDFDVTNDLKATLFCEPFAAQAGIRLQW